MRSVRHVRLSLAAPRAGSALPLRWAASSVRGSFAEPAPAARDLAGKGVEWTAIQNGETRVGANVQKGATYTWVPNHLADAHRRVSPRSLLVALSTAAKWLESKQSGSSLSVLTPTSIAEGVKAASEQRVIELEEDFPWIGEAKKRLEGLLVPCHAKDVISRLKQCDFRGTQKGLKSDEPRLVLDQLVELGISLTDPDGRYNVPDLSRVAMKMKRKGGIRVAG